MQDMVFQMSGAQSSRGTTEAQTNLQIALKLQNLLEQSGFGYSQPSKNRK